MNYEKNYYDYIEYVKKLNRKKNKNEYFEKHHIVPRCAGGNINEEELNKFMEEGWKRGGVKNRF